MNGECHGTLPSEHHTCIQVGIGRRDGAGLCCIAIKIHLVLVLSTTPRPQRSFPLRKMKRSFSVQSTVTVPPRSPSGISSREPRDVTASFSIPAGLARNTSANRRRFFFGQLGVSIDKGIGEGIAYRSLRLPTKSSCLDLSPGLEFEGSSLTGHRAPSRPRRPSSLLRNPVGS